MNYTLTSTEEVADYNYRTMVRSNIRKEERDRSFYCRELLGSFITCSMSDKFKITVHSTGKIGDRFLSLMISLFPEYKFEVDNYNQKIVSFYRKDWDIATMSLILYLLKTYSLYRLEGLETLEDLCGRILRHPSYPDDTPSRDKFLISFGLYCRVKYPDVINFKSDKIYSSGILSFTMQLLSRRKENWSQVVNILKEFVEKFRINADLVRMRVPMNPDKWNTEYYSFKELLEK